jgi:hypothetical protein
MKFGLVSMFAIYLVFRFFFNILISTLTLNRTISVQTFSTVAMIENVISLVFAIMIIRLAVKSGGRA